MNKKELHILLQADSEDEHLELKEAKNQYSFDNLIDYCVALGNEGGGKFILGVTSKKPRQIVGTNAFKNVQKIKEDIFNRLKIRIEVEEYTEDGKRTLIFYIPSRPLGIALNHRGKYLMRNGEELVGMDFMTLQRIASEAEPDFSAKICKDVTLEDLDESAINKIRELWYKKSQNKEILSYNTSKLLTDLELEEKGKYNYTCLLLLGKRLALSKYLACAEVTFEYRKNEANIEYQDREDFREAFILYFDNLWGKINARNEILHIREGFLVQDIKMYNEEVTREAILNAVAHRDYKHRASVFIKQSPQKISIENPGGFLPGINPENIIAVPSTPRNRRIAEVFQKIGFVEKSGQGADKIFRKTLEEGKGLPDYNQSTTDWVKLNINATVQDVEFIRYIQKIANKTQVSLSIEKLVILEKIRKEEKIKTASIQIRELLDEGLIERIGLRHQFILSKHYYTSTDKKAEYTRKRGLDKQANKELILNYFKQHKRGYKKDFIELFKGVGVSEWQIKRYLSELRNERKIKFIGNPKIYKGSNAGYWIIDK